MGLFNLATPEGLLGAGQTRQDMQFVVPDEGVAAGLLLRDHARIRAYLAHETLQVRRNRGLHACIRSGRDSLFFTALQ